jgi:hypothetical protein
MTEPDAHGTERRLVGVADVDPGHGRRAGDPSVPAPRDGFEEEAVTPNRRRWVPLAVADLAMVAVGFVTLIVIGVQKFGDADLASRQVAWYEDLVVFYGIGALFAVIAYFLFRSRIFRLAAVQAVLAVAVLGAGVASTATGDPKPAVVNPDQAPVPSESPSVDGG